jgi:hypothetical protein
LLSISARGADAPGDAPLRAYLSASAGRLEAEFLHGVELADSRR